MRRNTAHKYELLFFEDVSESSSATAFASYRLGLENWKHHP